MDFGTLKDLFTEKLIESYSSKSEDGKILFKKFVKTISESETLRTAFIVYKNIENNTIKSEIRANDYLKESLSLFSKFDNNPLVLENEKLVSILKEHDVDLSNLNQKELHKNLEIVLSTEKNASTLNRIEESKTELINWLMLDKKSEEIVDNNEYVKEGVDTQKFLEIVTNKFNEKYSNLTEEEKNILKVLREDNKEDGKKIVSSLVKETISILNTKIDSHKNNIDIKEKLLETKDTVYSMLENEGDLNNNILKLYDLKNNLKDE
jgi:hypothetical protein